MGGTKHLRHHVVRLYVAPPLVKEAGDGRPDPGRLPAPDGGPTEAGLDPSSMVAHEAGEAAAAGGPEAEGQPAGSSTSQPAMALEEVSQQFDATTIKRQYTNARVDAMDQMQQTLDGACEAQDDEAATLVFMKDRIEDYLRTSLPSPQSTLHYALHSLSLSLTRTAVLYCVLAHCAILQARSVRVRPH